MMKKTLAICLGLALILTLCGMFAGALASEVENGIDAIEEIRYNKLRKFRKRRIETVSKTRDKVSVIW